MSKKSNHRESGNQAERASQEPTQRPRRSTDAAGEAEFGDKVPRRLLFLWGAPIIIIVLAILVRIYVNG